MTFKALVVCVLASMSLNSFATCMSMCEDTDGGQYPELSGTGIMVTQCAAPGGPVHRSEERFKDSCKDGVHKEYSCSGMLGAQGMTEVKYECLKCSDDETTCLEVGSIL